MLGFECGDWWQSLLRVTSADLLEDIHHVKFDPFFDDLFGFDEGDVYVSDGNSFSCCWNVLILSCVSAMHCYAAHDLVAFGDLVFHGGLDVGESRKEYHLVAFSFVEIHWFSPCSRVKNVVGVYEFHYSVYISRFIGFEIAASYGLVEFRQHSVHTLQSTVIYWFLAAISDRSALPAGTFAAVF
jgi:hypothetical protein